MQCNDTPAWTSALIRCVNELVGELKIISNLSAQISKLEDTNNVRVSVIASLQEENVRLKKDISSSTI